MPTIILRRSQQFSLDITLSCGQVFRWEHLAGGCWRSIVGNRVIRIRQEGTRLDYSGVGRRFLEQYFSLDQDLPAITTSFDRDLFTHAAIARCLGLRIIRQPPWECLISYICATNSNIPMIKKRINHLARTFGKPVESCGETLFGFPEPEALATSCAKALSQCKMGYRGRYVKKTAQSIADPEEWGGQIGNLAYEPARKELMRLSGVGPKAADCILLFAFQKYEAFPVDVWIRRIMRDHYLPAQNREGSLTTSEYDRIRTFARNYFGEFCGYAQEYLFASREGDPVAGAAVRRRRPGTTA